MPTIPVDDFEWESLWDSTVALWMLPSDPAFRKELTDEIQGQVLFGLVDRFGAEHFKLDNEAVRLLHNAMPIKPSDAKDFQIPVLPAFIAGDILLTTLRLAVHMPDRASIENAIKIVAIREKKAKRPSSRASLMKVWKANKSVSHLSAAIVFSLPSLRALARALKAVAKMQKISVPGKPSPVSKPLMRRWIRQFKRQAHHLERAAHKHVPKFFANAERLRQLGETHYSATRRKVGISLLDPAEVWTVPPEFKLPRVRINFPRLSKEERAVLERAQAV